MSYPNEVGPANRALQQRFLDNPVASWAGAHLTRHRRHPTPEVHLEFYDGLIHESRAVFEAARSFAKSTTCSETFPLFLGCEYDRIREGVYGSMIRPHERVYLASNTGPKAEELIEHIRFEVEHNDAIKAKYGDLRGDVWTRRRLVFRNGFEIRCGGRGAQVRGFRPTLFIGDDLEDDEEVQSDEQMEKTRQWLDSAVLNTLDEVNCQGFFIGTPLHPECALRYLADKPTFVHRMFPAYDELGNPTWPSKWPEWRLEERRDEIGTRAFLAEFMLQPIIGDYTIFAEEWFREYRETDQFYVRDAERGFTTFIVCDPAISRQDGSDYTAIVTLSATLDNPPRIYARVGGVQRGHWSVLQTSDRIIDTHDAFAARELVVETNAYQLALADILRDALERDRKHVKVKEVIADKDKERRANKAAPTVQRGQLYICPDDPQQVRMRDECVMFQPGKKNIKKDLMDAMVHGINRINEWAKGQGRRKRSKRVLPKGHRLETMEASSA